MEGNNYEGKLQVKQDKQKRCSRGLQKKSETELAASVLKKKNPKHTRDKKNAFEWTKQDKTCKISRKSFCCFCLMVLLIELYMFIPLSVTLTIIISKLQQCQKEVFIENVQVFPVLSYQKAFFNLLCVLDFFQNSVSQLCFRLYFYSLIIRIILKKLMHVFKALRCDFFRTPSM